eukprot:scaffold602_cov298-Pinguiococcus_pyrenoidosus.AAC.24
MGACFSALKQLAVSRRSSCDLAISREKRTSVRVALSEAWEPKCALCFSSAASSPARTLSAVRRALPFAW